VAHYQVSVSCKHSPRICQTPVYFSYSGKWCKLLSPHRLCKENCL